jgi:hypothetical protein
VEPPKDLKTEGKIWKLKKPLYGLNDASQKFWLCVKEIFKKEGLKNVTGDKAFYFCHDDGILVGLILTHVKDFNTAGNRKFIDRIVGLLKMELKVSKIEKNRFRFTGVNIEKTDLGIEISMKDYANSMEMIEDIRAVKADDPLTKVELKVFRKYMGKLSWLAANTHPDFTFTALAMSKRNSCATIHDLKKVNHIIERMRSKPSKVVFRKIGRKVDLMVFGLSDASFKMDDHSISGILTLLGNKLNDKAVPIYRKSKTIVWVCHSAEAVETMSMVKMMDDVQFFMVQLEQLLFGTYLRRIPIKLFTDLKPLL